jgi:post-segregation antitoxin (ccd killing protein)
MAVVSVRLDDADVEFLRRRKENLSAFARHAIHDAVQRERMEQSLAELARLRAQQERPQESAEELIRRDRDAQYRRH